MASLPCQFHEDKGAVFTGTFIETGASLLICEECLRSFMATTLEGMTGIPITAIIEMDPAQFSSGAEQASEETTPVVDGLIFDDFPDVDETPEDDDTAPDAA